MMPVTKNFTIYHINAPGQEDQANSFPPTYEFLSDYWVFFYFLLRRAIYPTIDQLVETVNDVFTQLK
jgi:hypothetical protein